MNFWSYIFSDFDSFQKAYFLNYTAIILVQNIVEFQKMLDKYVN